MKAKKRKEKKRNKGKEKKRKEIKEEKTLPVTSLFVTFFLLAYMRLNSKI